jgi:squalene-hopene/tetraprenyl-beta-curcumene cyclase
VLEALAANGVERTIIRRRAARRGVSEAHQEADGSWYGRWGVDYIYGTFCALRGLAARGESDREAHILRAGEWLRSIQNADGGWGESCASYDNHTFTAGAQHAFADRLGDSGLIAGGDTTSSSVHNGIEYLMETQRPTEAGTKRWPPAPDSPRFLPEVSLYKDIRFRCWRCPRT